MATEQYVNLGTTTLTASLAGTSTATTFSVGSPGNLPTTAQFRVNIDNEILLVTALSTTTSTVTFTASRGQENTAVSSHTSGAAVTNVLTTGAFNQVRSELSQWGSVASRPASPRAGDQYHTSDDVIQFSYNGSTWDANGPINALYVPPGTASFTTTLNSTNTASLVVSQLTNGSIKLVQQGNAATQINGIVMATITTPNTLTACFQFTGYWANFTSYGLLQRDSGTSKLICFGPDFVNANLVAVEKFTDQTNFDSSYNRVSWLASPTVWLQIVDNGTICTYNYSNDGINYFGVTTQTRTAFLATPNQVGVYLNASNGNVGPGRLNFISWKYA